MSFADQLLRSGGTSLYVLFIWEDCCCCEFSLFSVRHVVCVFFPKFFAARPACFTGRLSMRGAGCAAAVTRLKMPGAKESQPAGQLLPLPRSCNRAACADLCAQNRAATSCKSSHQDW